MRLGITHTIVEAFQQTKDTINNEDSFNALGMPTSDDMAPVPKLKNQHFWAINPILSSAKDLPIFSEFGRGAKEKNYLARREGSRIIESDSNTFLLMMSCRVTPSSSPLNLSHLSRLRSPALAFTFDTLGLVSGSPISRYELCQQPDKSHPLNSSALSIRIRERASF